VKSLFFSSAYMMLLAGSRHTAQQTPVWADQLSILPCPFRTGTSLPRQRESEEGQRENSTAILKVREREKV
jgi:hypothetical protein